MSKIDKDLNKLIESELLKSIGESIAYTMSSNFPFRCTTNNKYSFEISHKISQLEYLTGMTLDTLLNKLKSGEIKIQKSSIYPRINLSTILGTKDD